MKSRSALAVGTATVAAAALIASGASNATSSPASAASAKSGGQVTFVSWGGTSQKAQQKAWLDPFQKSTGIKVVQDSPNTYAKIKAQVESGNVTWDAVVVGGDFGLSAADTKLLEKIDCSVVDCADLRPRELKTTGYRVPHTLLSVNLGYNTKALKGATPRSWADFFNTKKFPGKRALWNWSGSGVIELALLADGVSPKHLYPLNVKRALKKLDTIKDSTIWFSDPAQCDQLLRDGEASMAQCPETRILEAKKSGAPVGSVWNQALLTSDWLVIPKGAPHKDAAMKLIAWITSPQHNGAIAKALPGTGPDNAKARSGVPSRDLPSAHSDKGVFQSDEWYSKHGADLDKQFQEWVQKH
jgi:putative spermidine/putrescine transport system substrate-binding protein